MNEDQFKQVKQMFWAIWGMLALILFAIALSSCGPIAKITDPNGNTHLGANIPEDTIYIEPHNWQGVYQENDSIIGSDTLKYWTKD